MKPRRIVSSPLLFAALLLPSCVYADTLTPLDQDLNKTELGTKTGESK